MERELNKSLDPVEETSEESFPASDAPSWAMGEVTEEPSVRNNEAESRFEVTIDGKGAFLTYRLRPKAVAFIHVEVPVELEGRGIGGKLAQAGLEFARAQGLQAIPMCPFVTKYISRHREYLDLVPEELRAKIESN